MIYHHQSNLNHIKRCGLLIHEKFNMTNRNKGLIVIFLSVISILISQYVIGLLLLLLGIKYITD